jgi:hypothetical protein
MLRPLHALSTSKVLHAPQQQAVLREKFLGRMQAQVRQSQGQVTSPGLEKGSLEVLKDKTPASHLCILAHQQPCPSLLLHAVRPAAALQPPHPRWRFTLLNPLPQPPLHRAVSGAAGAAACSAQRRATADPRQHREAAGEQARHKGVRGLGPKADSRLQRHMRAGVRGMCLLIL